MDDVTRAMRYVGWGVVILAVALYFPEISFRWFDFSAAPAIADVLVQYGLLIVSLGFLLSPLMLEVFSDE